MRVLLAGATSELGREVLPRLVTAGHQVIAITRIPGSIEHYGLTPHGDGRVVEFIADLRNRADFLAAVAGLEIDAVINQLGSFVNPPNTARRVQENNRWRWEGTSTLVAAAKLTGATKFLSASAIYGYGFRHHGVGELDESTPFGLLPGSTLDPVQKALLSCEQQTHAIGGIVLRHGLLYRARGPIPVVSSDGRGALPFVHVEDAAVATVLALEGAAARSTYNVVDDEPVSWRSIHRARAEAFALPDPRELPGWYLRATSPLAGSLISQTSMRVSNSLARTELGWAPSYPSYRDALADAVEVAAHAGNVAAGRADVIRA